MQNKYQTLAGNTVKLGLGTFGSKILVFLMVRFYTEFLSPADYGAADLMTQTANLLLPLVSLGITDAVFRFAMDKAEDAAGVLTAGLFVILAGSVLALAMAFFGEFFLEDGAWLIAVFIIASNFHTLASQFMRAKGDMTLFAVQGLFNTALVIGLNILFLAVLHLGVMGAAMATLFSYVLVFLVRAVSIRRLLPFSLAVPTVLLDALLLTMQAAFLTLQLPGWIAIQAVSLTLLLILNGKPLLLAVKKLFGARRKGVSL